MDQPRKTFQVSIRTLLEITAAVAVILALVSSRGCSQVGRYHYIADERWGLVVYDSATGKFWQWRPDKWVPHDGPPEIGK
jgi:hypothetical protein